MTSLAPVLSATVEPGLHLDHDRLSIIVSQASEPDVVSLRRQLSPAFAGSAGFRGGAASPPSRPAGSSSTTRTNSQRFSSRQRPRLRRSPPCRPCAIRSFSSWTWQTRAAAQYLAVLRVPDQPRNFHAAGLGRLVACHDRRFQLAWASGLVHASRLRLAGQALASGRGFGFAAGSESSWHPGDQPALLAQLAGGVEPLGLRLKPQTEQVARPSPSRSTPTARRSFLAIRLALVMLDPPPRSRSRIRQIRLVAGRQSYESSLIRYSCSLLHWLAGAGIAPAPASCGPGGRSTSAPPLR